MRAARSRSDIEAIDSTELIRVSESGRGVVIVELNRPAKLNALVRPMRRILAETFEGLATREDARVCIVTGSGRGFCAGGDVKVMCGLIESDNAAQVQEFLELGGRVVTAIRALPLPVIAAVNGPAAGAGMNLALACDYRIASERASFGETFVNIGLHSDWGGAFFLPRLIGTSRALELFWSGRMLAAQEALELGIVDRIVPHESLLDTVLSFAGRLVEQPKHVLALTKQSVYESDRGLQHCLHRESAAQAACLRTRTSSARMHDFLGARER